MNGSNATKTTLMTGVKMGSMASDACSKGPPESGEIGRVHTVRRREGAMQDGMQPIQDPFDLKFEPQQIFYRPLLFCSTHFVLRTTHGCRKGCTPVAVRLAQTQAQQVLHRRVGAPTGRAAAKRDATEARQRTGSEPARHDRLEQTLYSPPLKPRPQRRRRATFGAARRTEPTP